MDERERRRAKAGDEARSFFEDLWSEGDPWSLETSELDQARHRRMAEMVGDRRYGRVLEVGCAGGSFTRSLARMADRVVAVDIAGPAIEQARVLVVEDNVELRVLNIMEHDLRSEPAYDLIVISETIYYLGWLYPMYDLAWLVAELFRATNHGGRALLVNSQGRPEGILSPWLVRTYRDLFSNVGYVVEREETLRGEKEGVTFDILATLFARASARDESSRRPSTVREP